ncbi:MAG: polysaccharide biosynthesis protein [Clostridia bacterium]|nr:polysaccharide biosynthesis protein [Clostridia bacterium]
MNETAKSASGKNKSLFFSGVLFLSGANVLVKIIGLLFKIPMSYFLGDEGMGYFNAAYQIYTWLYMLSTAGLPVAVSILISECRADGNAPRVRHIYRIAWYTFLSLGILGTGIMLFGAGPLAAAIGSPDARYCMMAISPTLFFICLAGALRGYFQGFLQMAPPAVSQVLEALGKLLVGVLFASLAIRRGLDLPIVAAAAISGLAVGEAAGFLYLLLSRRRYEKKHRFFMLTEGESKSTVHSVSPSRDILSRLVRIALPITASASVMSLTGLLDLVIVQRRLQSIGFSVTQATAFYGNYTTLVVPMFNLPPALIYPITTAVVPLLSATIAGGNRDGVTRTVQSVLRVASLISLPCALGLSLFARPILRLFFPADMAESAAPLLAILALAVFFLSLLTVTNAVLQANGMAGKPMIAMLVGGAVKLVCSYLLIGIPTVGTAGVPIGTLLCYFAALCVNLYFIIHHLGVYPSVSRILLRPAFAAFLAVGAARGLYSLLGGDAAARPTVLTPIAVAALIYVAAVFLFRAVTEEDLALLPFWGKIKHRLHKNRKSTENS